MPTTRITHEEGQRQARANYRAFVDRHLRQLIEHHPGSWVLLHDQEVVEVHETLDAALEAGKKRYPDYRFSIQEIREQVPIYMGSRVRR